MEINKFLFYHDLGKLRFVSRLRALGLLETSNPPNLKVYVMSDNAYSCFLFH
jgi:hypothetical protein